MEKLTRIPEFLTILKDFNCKTLTLTQAQEWYSLRELLDNDKLDNHIRQEKLEALQRLQLTLKKRRVEQLDQLEKICVNELTYLLQNHTPTTVYKTDIPAYRKAIDELFPRHPVLAFFKLPKTVQEQHKNDYAKRVKARQGERNFYLTGFIKKATSLLQSDSYIDISIGLCALTGRRPVEILLTGYFEKTENRLIYFGDKVIIRIDDGVIFSGQAKTKGAEDSKDNYLIPTLASPELVINALTRLRSLKNFKGKTTKQVNSLSAKTQNACVKREFSDNFDGDVKPYDLRHAYALICATRYCSNPSQYPKFYSAILGHRESDLQTKDSYMTLNMV